MNCLFSFCFPRSIKANAYFTSIPGVILLGDALLLRDHEAASSSLATPTKKCREMVIFLHFYFIFLGACVIYTPILPLKHRKALVGTLLS